MVDLIDGLVGRNSTEQGLSGRKSSGSAESSVGFQSVLNDVATEDASAYNRSNPRMANTRPDMESGNGLPDSDHNLPLASDGEGRQEILQANRWLVVRALMKGLRLLLRMVGSLRRSRRRFNRA